MIKPLVSLTTYSLYSLLDRTFRERLLSKLFVGGQADNESGNDVGSVMWLSACRLACAMDHPNLLQLLYQTPTSSFGSYSPIGTRKRPQIET